MSSGKEDIKSKAKRKRSSKDVLIPPLEEANNNENINPSTSKNKTVFISESNNSNINESTIQNTNVITTKNINENNNQNTTQMNIQSDSTSTNVIVNDSNNQNASINNSNPLDKISKYLPQSEKEEERFENKYEQQNIYMERKIVKAVNEILDQKKKKGKKLTKKDIYNNALKMYLEIAYNKTID